MPHHYTVALAGNPNVGKSTLFNALTHLHQHTGNWPGKTVATARGAFTYGGDLYTLVDLPGAYSLWADSPEEEIARDFLRSGQADATLVVADATCLERNLNLVLQIMEETHPVVLCVNLMDEAERKGISLDLTALQDALFLSGICAHVTLIHRREEFRGAQKLVEQVLARDNITCAMDSTVEGLLTQEGRLTGLNIHGRITGENRQLEVEGLFIAVGQKPQNEPFSGLIVLDEDGYILAGEDCKASLPGVFAAGDCRAKEVRQLTTAVGDGAVAGLAACRWVDEHTN